MDNKAIIIFGLLGLGLLFMLTRKTSGIASYPEESIALPFKPTNRVSSAHQYTNEESWDIEWSEDGLPKRVTIHRNAVQT